MVDNKGASSASCTDDCALIDTHGLSSYLVLISLALSAFVLPYPAAAAFHSSGLMPTTIVTTEKSSPRGTASGGVPAPVNPPTSLIMPGSNSGRYAGLFQCLGERASGFFRLHSNRSDWNADHQRSTVNSGASHNAPTCCRNNVDQQIRDQGYLN